MKPSAALSSLKYLISVQQPTFIWGPPGAGKSDIVRQVAAELTMELRDIRLSLLDPIDLKGFPVIDSVKQHMTWLPANFLPPTLVADPKSKTGKLIPNPSKGILFFDEMNSAPQSVQAAAYQLILDRKIGDYVLPAGWAMLAAGNRAGDRAIAHTQPSPLANRFAHLDFDVDVEDWYHWANKNSADSMLLAFIRFRPNLLHAFDSAANPRSFPTPRSWMFVNKIYKSGLDVATEFELIKGTVGEGAAAEFAAFTRLAKDLPSIDQILIAPEKTDLPTSPAAMYAICTALDKKTTRNNVDRVLKYVTRMPTEYQVLYLRSVVSSSPDVAQTAAFTKWVVENQAVLM